MTMPSLVLGSPQWLPATLAIVCVAGIAVAWSYARAGSRRTVKLTCAFLKILGFAALAMCLLEPLLTGRKPRKGANIFLVVADNSQSLQIRDDRAKKSRSDWMREQLKEETSWRKRLDKDYDVRAYTFDTRLHAVETFKGMNFKGHASALAPALGTLAKRYRGLPVAGILLFSDGNGTVPADLDWSQLPPIYPVLPPSRPTFKDLGVTRVTVNETNFEAAPVVIQAEVAARGYKGKEVVALVTNEEGKEIDRQQASPTKPSQTLSFRFQIRPNRRGVRFFQVSAYAASAEDESGLLKGDAAREVTQANNTHLTVVDRGGGPYRVLYVSGRPNWEFKYLRRSLAEVAEVHLVGLIRIARRAPKFSFRDMRAPRANPLFKGFDNPHAETAEDRDQPVLVRLGTRDAEELRDGFPRAAKDLFGYHAVILDDLGASFFTQDQLMHLRQFVSQRGGGFLMLGGPSSFGEGKYDRTPVGDILPVYLDRVRPYAEDQSYRLVLTREGWLQPWVRTRKTEEEERERLAATPAFQVLNASGNIKPGAATLARVQDTSGRYYPGLVAQPYGKGRTAALLVGDLWRWGLRRKKTEEVDFERSWRQTVRWLVANVPGRVEVETRSDESTSTTTELIVRAVDPEYLPLDNANVNIRITQPDGKEVKLTAEPDSQEAGKYAVKYAPKQMGAYRAFCTVTDANGKPVGQREAGWVSQPEADEFARVEPNDAYMQTLASSTKGEVVSGKKLDSFVRSLVNRQAPITETWVYPLWNHAIYFLITLLCLAAEWGLRRTNGLA